MIFCSFLTISVPFLFFQIQPLVSRTVSKLNRISLNDGWLHGCSSIWFARICTFHVILDIVFIVTELAGAKCAMENHYYTTGTSAYIRVNAASCSSYSALELRTNKYSFSARLVPRDFIIHHVVGLLLCSALFSLYQLGIRLFYTRYVSYSLFLFSTLYRACI